MTTTHPTPRQLLRREIAGTLGLLASADDLAAMRRYRTFLFEDHRTYLQQAEALLRSLAAQGRTTSVVLFDPAEFARFCAQEGLDPDTTDSRARYTAEAAALGPCILHEGEPLPSCSGAWSPNPSARPPGSTRATSWTSWATARAAPPRSPTTPSAGPHTSWAPPSTPPPPATTSSSAP